MNSILDLLISWAPMIVLIGVWIFFMKKMKHGNKSELFLDKISENNAELRQIRAALERIAVASERR